MCHLSPAMCHLSPLEALLPGEVDGTTDGQIDLTFDSVKRGRPSRIKLNQEAKLLKLEKNHRTFLTKPLIYNVLNM